ncbi:MAG: MAC/perforin domain-containing protein, partial [Kangiellaceae bacterium]|nr:MAC/perforin domain-containing protein [Kangiellaceae bacterium]
MRSGKFGGQLKVTKTMKTSKSMSAQQFARVSENEFKSMFATLQSQYSQKSSSFGLLGFSRKKKSTQQTANAKTETNYKSKSNAEQSQTQNAKQSEFTQTSVEAQGGNPEIAEALMDFYTPAFKQLFHDWIASINDYPKPFEFQLKSIHDLFSMSMKELFPAGNKDFGCGGGKPVKVESKTNKRFYIDTRVIVSGKKMVEEKVRVYCKFNSMEDFEKDMERRRMSLEKAISVYMVEGPFPTSSFELPAGETGCEEATLATFSSFGNFKSVMKFSELKSSPFILAFDLPLPIPGIATPQAKFKMGMKGPLWFAIDPQQTMIHMYDGCQVAASEGTKICFRNIILTYDESTGFFHVDPKDFAAAKLRIPSLPNWLSGSTVARPKRLETADDVRGKVQSKRVSVPCNVK